MFGFLNIHKSQGMTSHDVVAAVRRRWRIKKVGHAGTLDPLATGVLILCVGGATRLSDYVMHQTKHYRAQITLGIKTDTYDSEGQALATVNASHITRADVERSLLPFIGDIDQVPPMYSAIKKDGKKLYDLARQGIEIERETRRVHIESLTLTDFQSPHATVDVICSAGTYIRSLAYDIGEALDVGAHMSALTRLASGTFTLENAITLDELSASDSLADHLIPPQIALANWDSRQVTPEEEAALRQGKFIPKHSDEQGVQLVMAYNQAGEFVAILETREQFWKPNKVFNSLDN